MAIITDKSFDEVRWEHALAQLRHAYKHSVSGTIGDSQAFAKLIRPGIVALEELLAHTHALKTVNDLLNQQQSDPEDGEGGA